MDSSFCNMKQMGRKICLVIDNYDSFTDNLLHLFKSVTSEIEYKVLRNDDERILIEQFDYLLISPGPMTPQETGLLKDLFDTRVVPHEIPTFGVCLGMQFLSHYFNGKVSKTSIAMHGSTVNICIEDYTKLFKGVKTSFKAARYNSLEVSNMSSINVLAKDDSGMIMALEHDTLPFVGVQFHPESFLTEFGEKIVTNFFKYYA